MRLAEARIRNFRGLKNIEFSTSSPVTVIVGPNAVGKTSIFEAIRLHKALLSPTVNAGAKVHHLPEEKCITYRQGRGDCWGLVRGCARGIFPLARLWN